MWHLADIFAFVRTKHEMSPSSKIGSALEEEQAPCGPEFNLPGLTFLREAVANYLRIDPGSRSVRRDGLASLTIALSAVPDGMAAGVLAGVNPIHGLYACMVAPIVGGILSSTQLMIVSTTSAAALMAGQAMADAPSADRAALLFTMVVLIGIFQVLFGLLGLGKLTRFVSYSVMTGFVIGIAVLTILTQLSTVTGYDMSGSNRVAQALDLLVNLDKVKPASVGIALLALILILLPGRSWVQSTASLLAIAVPSALVAVFAFDDVQLVRELGEISGGFPTVFIPRPALLTFDVVTMAFAISLVILVQGAGVSQSVPNPDGSRRRISSDFVAQGAANIASGLLRGLPVGASLGSTALAVAAGARTRLASISAGITMAMILLFFSDIVSYVAMPALGALLIYASAKTISLDDIQAIWAVGWPSIVAASTTFVSILFLPIQASVCIGAALSMVLYAYELSNETSIVQLIRRGDGLIEERRPPKLLTNNQVTVLDVYGHLFYAGARTLARLLPKPDDTENPVVILRLRGRKRMGATLVEVLSSYAKALSEAHGRLYLSGVSDEAYDLLTGPGKLRLATPVPVFGATPILGESTERAYAEANAWLVEQGADSFRATEGS